MYSYKTSDKSIGLGAAFVGVMYRYISGKQFLQISHPTSMETPAATGKNC
jgi:hypothetical protein